MTTKLQKRIRIGKWRVNFCLSLYRGYEAYSWWYTSKKSYGTSTWPVGFPRSSKARLKKIHDGYVKEILAIQNYE